MISLILLAIGLLLIFLEFYLPGVILGVLGGVLVLGSVIVFASQNNSPLAIIFYLLGVGLSIWLLIRFTLAHIVKTKSAFSIYSNKDQEGYQASEYDHTAIGKIGTVMSDLKPGGYILIDGVQHQAISLSGYVTKGESVEVISGQEESLMVKFHKKESHL